MKYVFILFLFSLTLVACDILSTREPEAPRQPRANYVPATTPEVLIQNLTNSFKDRVTENYLLCFSEKKFQFSPSAGSVGQFTFLSSWTLQDERQYFNNLVNAVPQNAQITLNFQNEEKTPYGDSTSYNAKYTLSVPFTDDQKPKYYQGTVRFTFIKDNNNQWVISFWADIKDQQYPSWSELKGRLN